MNVKEGAKPMYDFDKTIELWDPLSHKWGSFPEDVIPMFVAVMDFEATPAVCDALNTRLKNRVFGYERAGDQFLDTASGWFKRVYGLDVPRDWLLPLTGIVPALAALANLTPHAAVLTNTPNYVGLLRAPEYAGKKVIRSPLITERAPDGLLRYRLDYDDLKRRAAGTGVFYLTNPLNPVGKVFERSELEELSRFANEERLIVLSDEIHCELIYGKRHIPYFDVDPDNSIALYAAGKICNIAGLPHAFAVVPNPELRERVRRIALTMGHPGTLEYVAAEAAFSAKSDEWKRELNDYLAANRDYLESELRRRFPDADFPHTDATYLQWIDFGRYIDGGAKQFLREHAKVELTDGVSFGGAEEHVRLNFGCPRFRLAEALDRIENAINSGGGLRRTGAAP
ncbi:MAG: aminotransferase class I/II-fold pyridoxal phosphate-dependent enzyme [Oscillospiraceae bacterium]|jgi:cystathionine beta-lyase|nr:aminotransferase class I/II-fold pyridoxal phosphate-dependent enzyme [Oscillospiraceae bacterium]